MPKKISILVTEELVSLEKLYSKTLEPLKKDRIKTLIYIKNNKYSYVKDIANKLGRQDKTVGIWVQRYKGGGMEALLEVKSGGNNTRTISNKMVSAIAEKLDDPNTSITSYVELKLTLEEELGEFIEYGALYTHCKRKHKSKLKVARKSHYKKDPTAEAVFKKP